MRHNKHIKNKKFKKTLAYIHAYFIEYTSMLPSYMRERSAHVMMWKSEDYTRIPQR